MNVYEFHPSQQILLSSRKNARRQEKFKTFKKKLELCISFYSGFTCVDSHLQGCDDLSDWTLYPLWA